MAKYFSPIGSFSGKIGELVFFHSNGKKWVRIAPRGNKNKNLYKKATKRSLSKMEKRRLNYRLIFGFLAKFYSKTNPLIKRWWTKQMLIENSKSKLSPQALFMSKNLHLLFHSVAQKDEILSEQNPLDFSKLIVSKGRLQPPKNLTHSYTPENGELIIKLNQLNKLNITVLYIPTPYFTSHKKPWNKMKVWIYTKTNGLTPLTKTMGRLKPSLQPVERGFIPRRNIILEIDPNLSREFLHIWAFFSNDLSCSPASYSTPKN